MSPVQRMTLGRGGEEHDAAEAAVLRAGRDRFAGKVAIVTGAGSGIGRGVAERLAREGAAVAGWDLAKDNLEATVAAVGAEGGRMIAIVCDVTSESSVGDAMAATVAALGPPDVVCNVAGIGSFSHTTDLTLDQWERTLAVNLTGPFLVCRAALPHMVDRGGSIVNVASNTALMGQAYAAAYCASKGGVLLLSKALAAEFLSRKVRVNVVAPGGVDTPLIGSFMLPEGADDRVLNRIMTPMGYSTPAEIAASVAFLASDESSYTTGAVLSVDGGITI